MGALTRKMVKAEMIGRRADLDQAVLDKALDKTVRWMKAAYGATDWDELKNESGDVTETVMYYYKETLAEPDGKNTSNRQSFNRNKE